jgi:hypothetical protein
MFDTYKKENENFIKQLDRTSLIDMINYIDQLLIK